MRAIDGRRRDPSLRLVFASVPVQALLMAGVAALAIGGASASPAQGTPAYQAYAKASLACPPGRAVAAGGLSTGTALLPSAVPGTVRRAWDAGKRVCVLYGTYNPAGDSPNTSTELCC